MPRGVREGGVMSKWLMLSFVLTLLLSACDLLKGSGSDSPSTKSLDKDASSSSMPDARIAGTLNFSQEGEPLDSSPVATLATEYGTEEWEAYDPYYKKKKRWRTIRLLPLIKQYFSLDVDSIREKTFIMRAQDGYSVPIAGEQLITDDAYLAIQDLDFPEWELAGKQKANPGPVYLVWKQEAHHDLHEWPRPWQLQTIDLASFEQTFSHTIPADVIAGSPTEKGFEIFKTQCVRCHAVNQHGGHVGPELNIPQNITEYRPKAQILAYIKNPMTFRYGNMPAFEHLSEEDLDNVYAYLSAMKDQKWTPPAERVQ